MKRLVLISVVLLFAGSVAFAQGGALGIYSDQVGSSCYLSGQLFVPVTYWVVHQLTPGATAVAFSAPQPACMMGAIFLGDIMMQPVQIGNSQIGVAVGYAGCFTSPITVLGIQYLPVAPIPPCCPYPVLPDPMAPSGTIEVTDCGFNLITGVPGGTSMVEGNPNDCICDGVIGVEESTWGSIKALYRD